MQKKQFLRILENKFETLEGSDITGLIVEGKCEEASKLLKQIEYHTLESYINESQFEKIETWEIPESCKTTFIWYIFGSKHSEEELIANEESWRKDLLESTKNTKYESIVKRIVSKLAKNHVNNYHTLEELVA